MAQYLWVLVTKINCPKDRRVVRSSRMVAATLYIRIQGKNCQIVGDDHIDYGLHQENPYIFMFRGSPTSSGRITNSNLSTYEFSTT